MLTLYVISLTNARDRRAKIKAELDRQGIPFEFFDALKGDNGWEPYFHDYDSATYELITRRRATPGEIGCYASHKALWKRCAESDHPVAVLEDDAEISAEFIKALEVAQKLTANSGFLRLEANKKPAFAGLPERDELVCHTGGFDVRYLKHTALCSTAYVIGPNTAKNFVRHSDILRAPVDRFIQFAWLHREPLFLLDPPVTHQNHAGSVIDAERRLAKIEAHWNALHFSKRFWLLLGNALKRWRFNRSVGRRASQLLANYLHNEPGSAAQAKEDHSGI